MEMRLGRYVVEIQPSEPPEELVRECAAIAVAHVQRAMEADLMFGKPGDPGCTCFDPGAALGPCDACYKRSCARFAYAYPEAVREAREMARRLTRR